MKNGGSIIRLAVESAPNRGILFRRNQTLDTSQALERFLAHIERRAYRIAYIATGNNEDALDIVQEAMYKLVKHYRDRTEEEWPMLFHRILQNYIRDWYRRSKVRNSLHIIFGFGKNKDGDTDEDPLERLPDIAASQPSEQLSKEQVIKHLDGALQQLPLRQQQAFLLRAWEGLDVAETAQAMGCSQGSVKTHYSRAVHTLREILGE